jgi:bacterioferritin-associated ferredoxin
MIVCSCNVVSDAMVKAALAPADGKLCPRTPSAVYKRLGCSPCCGRCFVTVREIIDETLGAHGREHSHTPSSGASCNGNLAAPLDGASVLAASA